MFIRPLQTRTWFANKLPSRPGSERHSMVYRSCATNRNIWRLSSAHQRICNAMLKLLLVASSIIGRNKKRPRPLCHTAPCGCFGKQDSMVLLVLAIWGVYFYDRFDFKIIRKEAQNGKHVWNERPTTTSQSCEPLNVWTPCFAWRTLRSVDLRWVWQWPKESNYTVYGQLFLQRSLSLCLASAS